MKFAVLRITNQPRRLRRFRLRAGNATNLKADLSIMPLEEWGTPASESVLGKWSDIIQLSWYRDGWDSEFRPTDASDQGGPMAVARAKQAFTYPPLLIEKYLKNETIDMLPTNRPAYLWLFFTIDNIPKLFHTAGSFQGAIQGKYKLNVGISSSELSLREQTFVLKLRDRYDFTVKKD